MRMPFFGSRAGTERGFTSIELMIVIAIIGILAALVRVSYDPQESKVKSQASRLRGDLNFARSEAVNRNRNVRVNFYFDDDATVADRQDLDGDGDMDDGYRIWIDDNGNGAYDNDWDDTPPTGNNNEICDPDEGDCELKAVAFAGPVRFYDVDATDGPLETPGGDPISFEDSDTNDDGVAMTFGLDWLAFQPDGAPNANGTIYIYAPSTEDDTVMKVAPYAVVVSPTSGRVRVMRWRKSSSSWETR